jgi:hypothetical protein
MGKLKERYLNNLTSDEIEERYGISAFEYIELMENYKHLFDDNGNPIPDDVIEQMIKERESAEAEYYEQSAIDEINDSMKLKYTDNDILYVLDGIAGPLLTNMILSKLRDVWNTKNGVF